MENLPFKIEKLDEENRVQVVLDPNHQLFDGHFPNQPVVPGVVLVQIVEHSVKDLLNRDLKVKEIKNIKFMKPVDPISMGKFQLEVSIKENEGEITIKAVGFNNEEKLFSLSGKYQ